MNMLPFGENGKVAFGVATLLGISYVPLYLRKKEATGFDTMAEKREVEAEEAKLKAAGGRRVDSGSPFSPR